MTYTVLFNDGGRREAGYKGMAGDCACRAVAIASGLPYAEVYAFIAHNNATQRMTKRTRPSIKRRSAGNGVYTQRKWFKDYMQSLGFVWVSTMGIGTGCRVHLDPAELPQGRLICKLSHHVTAVINGVINDTFDPRRGRCIYGFYMHGDDIHLLKDWQFDLAEGGGLW